MNAAAAAGQCGCGHELCQHFETVRVLLQEQLTGAYLTLVLLLTLDMAALSGAVYAAVHGFIVFSALGFTALILMTGRAAQKVLSARAQLRRFTEHYHGLPRAVVHRCQGTMR